MRRFIGWIAGLVSIAALARILARRRRGPDLAVPELSEPAAPVPDAAPPAEELTIEERRARVHGRAQEVIDAMRDESSES